MTRNEFVRGCLGVLGKKSDELLVWIDFAQIGSDDTNTKFFTKHFGHLTFKIQFTSSSYSLPAPTYLSLIFKERFCFFEYQPSSSHSIWLRRSIYQDLLASFHLKYPLCASSSICISKLPNFLDIFPSPTWYLSGLNLPFQKVHFQQFTLASQRWDPRKLGIVFTFVRPRSLKACYKSLDLSSQNNSQVNYPSRVSEVASTNYIMQSGFRGWFIVSTSHNVNFRNPTSADPTSDRNNTKEDILPDRYGIRGIGFIGTQIIDSQAEI
jgi:hypothetical protein